ncbi:reverse transcriptase domain-containing protein [Tanacetum coccineum]
MAHETNQNNRNKNGNRNGNRIGTNGNIGGAVQATRACTYKDFLNYQPRNFNETKGFVGLARWFEKMESVFRISNYATDCQVKFATCTLLDGTLNWWNSHVKTIGIDAAYGMPCNELMKLIMEVYCPRNEIQKMENELWNLIVKGMDVTGYTQRFKELAILCSRMVSNEEKNIERYVWCLPNNIQGNVTSSVPIRLQDAIKMAKSLMDQKVHDNATRQAESKRKWENNPRDNHVQQPPHKKQNVVRAYTAGANEKKEYAGSLPYCNKYKLHHVGPCIVKCSNCKKVGHMATDYKAPIVATNQRAPIANQKVVVTCYECGRLGHYKSECPKLKNQNHGNLVGNEEAQGRAFAL